MDLSQIKSNLQSERKVTDSKIELEPSISTSVPPPNATESNISFIDAYKSDLVQREKSSMATMLNNAVVEEIDDKLIIHLPNEVIINQFNEELGYANRLFNRVHPDKPKTIEYALKLTVGEGNYLTSTEIIQKMMDENESFKRLVNKYKLL